MEKTTDNNTKSVSSVSLPENLTKTIDQITWFGQASIRIAAGGKIIYVDPLFFDKNDKADIILITHLHDDHYKPANIKALTKDSTIVIAPKDLGSSNIVMNPGQERTVSDIKIETVPAYNLVKTGFHPKSAGNNGYIITIDGVRIYHSGDTEKIPEMKNFACDIALIPLGQTYTFDSVDEAVEAVLDVRAVAAIPIHFGMYEGKKTDATGFLSKLETKGIYVKILEQKK